MLTDADEISHHYSPSTRLVDVERNGSASWGFHLTRSKWDPYPWISSIDEGTAAFSAGIRTGDCLIEVNGEDVIGQRVSEVAEIVKSKPDQVSLLLWNAGVDPQCSPEAVCCGPMPTNLQRLSACMSTILAFLECPVCLDTIGPPTYQCDNGHLICIRCRAKSERCPVCRIRFSSGRSLLSDQVYNALIDSFNLREEPDGARSAKMQQIFKLKNKQRNNPRIKITQSHTNKFLARLTGKSSSVDNLSKSVGSGGPHQVNHREFNLKTKSLSSNEIFQSESSDAVSRSSSASRLNNRTERTFLAPDASRRPSSCHGSFESLFCRKSDSDQTQINTNNKGSSEDDLFHCPFSSNCTFLVKERNLIEHFQLSHDGPLIQFFKPHVSVRIEKVVKNGDLTYVIQFDGTTFFLKLQIISHANGLETGSSESGNILLWTWILGNKTASKDYNMQVVVRSGGAEIFSVRNCVSSLSSTSYLEMRDMKKGVLINPKSINLVQNDTVLDISVVRSEIDD